jgi:putative endopeptidase
MISNNLGGPSCQALPSHNHSNCANLAASPNGIGLEENDLFTPSRFQPTEDISFQAPARPKTRLRTEVLPGYQGPAQHGVFLSDMDVTVDPAKDFYHYAAGNWLKATQAAAKPDGTYISLAKRSAAAQTEILKQSAINPTTPNQKMLGDFYSSGLSVEAANAKGLAPLSPLLSKIDGLTDLQQLPALLGELQKSGLSGLGFNYAPSPNSATHTYLGGVGPADGRLPAADLVGEKPENLAHRNAYQSHIAKTFELSGVSSEESAKAAATVLEVETRLAKAVGDKPIPPELLSMEELKQLAPAFDWSSYFSALGCPAQDHVVVKQKPYFAEMQNISVEEWKTCLRWNSLNALTYVLPTQFADQDAAFRSELSGKPIKVPDRSRSILSITNEFLGMPLGMEFAQRYFSPEEKAKGQEMVSNVRGAIGEMIASSTWLEPSTKAAAKNKLENMMLMLGAPEKLDDSFSQLSFDRENYLGNVLNLYEQRFHKSIQSVGTEIPRDRWIFTPQTANAAYNPTANSFTITSLYFEQPTFFPNDEASNYGAVGAVIGHEISHGFDNKGSKFDWDGRKHDWWDAGDRAEFEKIVERMVADANAHEVLPGLFLRGQAVVGESMADLMGVAAAYKAFKKSQVGKPQEKIDGFTPDQRFFLSYAQFRKQWTDDETLTHQVKTDPHPNSQFRVNETFYNNPDFYQAFQLTPKPDIIQVW